MNAALKTRLKKNIVLDYFHTFVTNLNMQSSIWVLYLAYCGMSLAQVGLLEGVYHITSMIFEIPSGAIADLLGRKKSMIVSKTCIAVSCLIMLYSKSFWLFALSFFIQALGNNFNSGSEEALVYDSMKAIGEEEKYITVNGRLNILIEVAQGIATVAGGILAEYSFYWCYFASLVIALLAFFPVIGMTEAPFEKQQSARNGIWKMLKDHFGTCIAVLKKDLRILRIVIYFSAVFASQTLLFFYGQQYFSDLGYNKIYISVFMLQYSMFCCLGAYCSDRLFERFGRRIAVTASFIIAGAIACFVFEVAWFSVAMLSAAGFCNSLLYPIQSAILNGLIPSEQRATLISVNSMFFSIAMIIFFPVAGFLADEMGLGRVLFGIGCLLVVFTVSWRKKIMD
ncbi:MAG: MFS transporter [Acetatifactor sp.]